MFVRAAAALLGFALLGCSAPAASAQSPAEPASPAVSQPSGSAMAVLESLPVKGRSPMTGYDRDSFGPAWFDTDGNGCYTRDDILSRDLVERTMSGNCVVTSGVLYPDPYTGEKIVYVRGKSLVDIDHVVSLGNAWVTGASSWPASKRLELANDPYNLLAVSASANRQKSDSDAASWLPSNKSYRCEMVARQVGVKAKYGLWVTAPEKAAISKVLSSCPAQQVPAPGLPVAPSPSPSDAPPSSQPAGPAHYKTCADARAAGVAPILRSASPELYEENKHLDRDGDGRACT